MAARTPESACKGLALDRNNHATSQSFSSTKLPSSSTSRGRRLRAMSQDPLAEFIDPKLKPRTTSTSTNTPTCSPFTAASRSPSSLRLSRPILNRLDSESTDISDSSTNANSSISWLTHISHHTYGHDLSGEEDSLSNSISSLSKPSTSSVLVPPLGFAMVVPGVYRSGHPNHRNISFLDGLGLNSIMYLCTDNYRPHTANWAQKRGLNIFHFRIDSFKQPSTSSPSNDQFLQALAPLLDSRYLPILLHCDKGKHRVGTLCALLRLVQGWSLDSTWLEWRKFLDEGTLPSGSNGIENWNQVNTLPTRYNDRASLSEDDGDVKLSKGQGKKKAEDLVRAAEWDFVESFPLQKLVRVDPNWRPDWLDVERLEDLSST